MVYILQTLLKWIFFSKNLPTPCVSFYCLFIFKKVSKNCMLAHWRLRPSSHCLSLPFPEAQFPPPGAAQKLSRNPSTFLRISPSPSQGPVETKQRCGGWGTEGRSRAFQFGTKGGRGAPVSLQLADCLCRGQSLDIVLFVLNSPFEG